MIIDQILALLTNNQQFNIQIKASVPTEASSDQVATPSDGSAPPTESSGAPAEANPVEVAPPTEAPTAEALPPGNTNKSLGRNVYYFDKVWCEKPYTLEMMIRQKSYIYIKAWKYGTLHILSL